MSSVYQQIASLPPDKRAVLELMLKKQGVDLTQMPILPEAGPRDSFPLSFAQQRMWFLDQLEPGNPLYNICSPVHIRGKLNEDAFRRTFELIVEKHETLRTTFFKEGAEARQKIHPHTELDFETIELDSETDLQQKIVSEANISFNLQKRLPMRIRLFKLGAEEHVAVLTLHHIVSDNWSTGVLIREFMNFYPVLAQGGEVTIQPLRVQYADFAAWQRKWLSGKTLEKQLLYWEEKLSGLPAALDLPTDFPRPAYQTHNGDFLTFELGMTLSNSLKKLAAQYDVTLFMALMAAFQILMLHYSRQEDFAVGTPIANRNRAEIEPLIGFFINTLVIRSDTIDNPTVSTLLKKIKETMIGAYAHQDLPFEMLVEKLDPERDMSQSPLFQTMLVFNNAPVDKLELPNAQLELIGFENKTSKFDLIFNFMESESGLEGKVEFNTDLFKPGTVRAMIRHFTRVVEAMSSGPDKAIGDIALLNTDEKEHILKTLRAQFREVKASKLLLPLILEQCRSGADKIALSNTDGDMTYADLKSHISVVQKVLQDKKIQPGEVVAVVARRTPAAVAILLGVMAHGAVYLPIDPAYPGERLEFMLKDSGARCVLMEAGWKPSAAEFLVSSRLPVYAVDGAPDRLQNMEVYQNEDAPAYLIYTSGSSGKPKGVLVSHRAIADHTVDMCAYFGLTENDRSLQFAAMNFDAALEQILSPLCAGATIVLRDEDIWPVEKFADKINDMGLTVVNPTTAYWNQWCAHLAENGSTNCPTLRLVISGGDAMTPTALKHWRQSALKGVRLINAYGPTETVITSTCFDVPDESLVLEHNRSLPIGLPNANRTAYVLDERQRLLPFGLPGELCIAGKNLASGYHNRPQEEALAFVDDPFTPGQKMYRTGDKVRLHENGIIEFLGRIDAQVKIRGFRIEPGEVENILSQHPDLETALIAIKTDVMGEKQVVAYFRPKAGAVVSIPALRTFMKNQLPPYMLPAAFIQLETVPMLPGGKVNRRALPVPEDLRGQLSAEYVAPRTETEEKLAAIVAQVLRIEKVGVFDNFFELGGHSMLGTQVMSMIREQFGVEVPLRALFESPTVDGIAASLMEELTGAIDEKELSNLLDDMDDLSGDELDALLNDD